MAGQRTVKLLLAGSAVGFAALFFGVWIYFHMIPTEGELRSLLRQGQAIEIFRFKDDIPVRWVRFEDPDKWASLENSIHYKAKFWQFSRPPEDSIVLQVFIDGKRHVWEVRGDNSIHLRKAVRWYKMPVEPEFENLLRQILDEFGEDLDPQEQRKRYSPSFKPQ